MPYEFYIKPIYYDDDFAFYVGDSRVDEQRTLRYTAEAPMQAYAKFAEATTIHSFYGKDCGTSGHVEYFRTLFYVDLKKAIEAIEAIEAKESSVDNDSCLDIVFDADGCFDYCYGGNQDIEFGIRKVFDFKVKSYSDFKTQYLQIELERTKYLEKMLAEYNAEKFFPALDALESASHDVVKQLGLVDKRYLKQVLKVAREINPRIVPTLPDPNAGT